MRSATSTFRGVPSSVSAARRWVLATLEEWGMAEAGWSAAQVVSELATNSTLHARSDFTVRLALDGTLVRLEAEDASPVPLQARSYGPTSTTGRGLGIVDVLAVEWGVTASATGKTVWVLLAPDATDVVPPEDDASGHGRDLAAGTTSGASSGKGAAA